jgi:ERCC4-type nuclease
MDDKQLNFNGVREGVSIPPPRIVVNPARIHYVPPVPKDFVIVVDSNEQKPMKFGKIPTVTKKLDSGDYGILGMEYSVCIERKSQADFYGSIVGDGRERLYLMFERTKGYGFKAFVIECEESEILTPELTHSRVKPSSIYATVASWEIKHGYHFYYGNRRACAVKVANWLINYYNMTKHVKRKLKRSKLKDEIK